MSYILDAIKKADRKRKLGEVPDVDTIHEAPESEPRRFGWLYGLAAILFVNAGGIVWLLWFKAPEKAPVVQTPASQQAALEQQAPPAPAAMAPVRKSVESVPQPLPASVPPAQPGAPVQPQSAAGKVAEQVQPAQESKAAAPPQAAQAVTAPAQPAVPVQAQTEAPKVAEPPQADQVQAVASAAPQVSVPAASPAKPVAGRQAPAEKAPSAGKTEGAAPISAAKSALPAAVAQGKSPATPEAAVSPPANQAAFVPVQEENPSPPDAAAVDVQAQDDTAVGSEESLPATEEAPVEELTDEAGGAAEGEVLKPIATSPAPKEKAKRSRQEEDPELANIPFLKQLPADIQKSIPELHISFHSYSIKPASRLVSISGKIMHEGQDFEENLKLEKITTKGVVFNYKGKLFRLDV